MTLLRLRYSLLRGLRFSPAPHSDMGNNFKKGEDEMISKETKTTLIEEYKINERDTGSPEVQVAILTNRINELTEHMKKNPKDYPSVKNAVIAARKIKNVKQEKKYLTLLAEVAPEAEKAAVQARLKALDTRKK